MPTRPQWSSGDPDRYEYALTQRGKDLYPAIVALLRWGDEYLAGPEGPPLILHHTACGHDAAPVLVCRHCTQPIRATDIQPQPGPGAHAEHPLRARSGLKRDRPERSS